MSEKTRPLHFRDFRVLATTRFFSSLALQIQGVAVGWQVYSLRHDALLLGLLGLAEGVPAIGFSFVSGHVVDSSRAALVYRLSLVALVLNALLLFAAALPLLPISTDLRLVLLFAGVFVSGAARSFSAPAVYSLIPRLLPRPLLGAASALNSSVYQVASILGPPIGGFAFELGGGAVSFALPPILLGLALLSCQFLSPAAKALAGRPEREPFFKSVANGLAFTFSHKVLLSAMTLDMFSVLFGGAVAVLPVFADQVFRGGPMGLGILRAAPSVGSAVIALWLGFRPLRVISGRMLMIAVAGFGATTVLFALAPSFWFAAFFLGASGAFDGVSMVIRSTILQLCTPDDMRGRVSAVSSVFITSSNEIGAFESGFAARALGLIPSVVFGGLMTLGVVGVTAWAAPELSRTRLKQD